MQEKISAVYKITNIVTGEFYIGSSRNVKHRWEQHKKPQHWKEKPNSQLYKDMQKYGVDKFNFEILKQVEPECLKQVEQEFIDMLNPVYNDRNANGWNIKRYKETKRKYRQTDKGREVTKKTNRKVSKRYDNRLCLYNGEVLKHQALRARFYRAGIPHSALEANKYLIK